MFIVADKLSKTYNSNGVETKALKEASFSIDEGSFTVILGPSGAGKTTLLNLLGGMDQISSGSLIVGDTKLVGLNKKELTLYRRNKVGFVFQFYNLMPNLTALENVELAVEVCSNHLDPFNVIKSVGLEERANNFPSQLSGGEQQRVSIARAIAKNPELLLCDEPTGALDSNTGKNILKLLHDFCKNEKKTIIIVTHNAAIKEIADQVIYIKNGSIDKIELNASPASIESVNW
ncbi:MAG TPA: ABC transporter ATP-binding protein [Firmicutes bacterium]|jgi:ABC transporter related|nr:aBC-type antimicrobial peptide transport system ATPase component [Clostridium sp. CAG:288]HAR48062.1 ABC transporter ATP-binding protein [Bacillota bacterium]HAW99873.1 ABC transporter ATP-binding protein [Bacillota bacterium]